MPSIKKEMGGDGREQPFFFLKSEHALVARAAKCITPRRLRTTITRRAVVALGRAAGASTCGAPRFIFGYAVGLDMTRRDLQQWGKDAWRPWTRQELDESGPCSELLPAAKMAIPRGARSGSMSMASSASARSRRHDLVGARADRHLSEHYTPRAGDLIFTARRRVGPVKPGR